MRIQSRIKDYYDYVSHQFGADPDVVYVREPLKKTSFSWPEGKGFFLDTCIKGQDYNHYMEFVVAGPHVITLICTSTLRDTHKEILGEKHYPLLNRSWRANGKFLDLPQLPSGRSLEDLIRLVDAPVFLVQGKSYSYDREPYLLVDERIPILQDLGVPSIISAEQMWQGIYSTLINVLRKNPDKNPPVVVEDKVRLQKAGFDLRTSFRHPIKLK